MAIPTDEVRNLMTEAISMALQNTVRSYRSGCSNAADIQAIEKLSQVLSHGCDGPKQAEDRMRTVDIADYSQEMQLLTNASASFQES